MVVKPLVGPMQASLPFPDGERTGRLPAEHRVALCTYVGMGSNVPTLDSRLEWASRFAERQLEPTLGSQPGA